MLNSIKWLYFIELFPKLLSTLSILIAAKFIPPSEYGLASYFLIYCGYFRAILETTASKIVLQAEININNTIQQNHLNSVIFSLGLLFSPFPLILIAIFSPEKIESTKLFISLLLICLTIPLGSLNSIAIAKLSKNLDFQRIFIAQCIGALASTFCLGILLILEKSFFPVIFSNFINILSLSLYLFTTKRLDAPPLGSLFTDAKLKIDFLIFNTWHFFESKLNWLSSWLDALIIALLLTSNDLGVFRMGSAIPIMLFSSLVFPFSQFFASNLANSKTHAKSTKCNILNAQNTILELSLLIVIGCYIFGDTFVLIFGNQWTGIQHIIVGISLSMSISYISSCYTDFYRINGRSKLATQIQLVKIFYHAPAYYFLLTFNLKFFLIGKTLLSIIDQLLEFKIQKEIINISAYDFYQVKINILVRYILILALIMVFDTFMEDQPLHKYYYITPIYLLYSFNIFHRNMKMKKNQF